MEHVAARTVLIIPSLIMRQCVSFSLLLLNTHHLRVCDFFLTFLWILFGKTVGHLVDELPYFSRVLLDAHALLNIELGPHRLAHDELGHHVAEAACHWTGV